MTTEIEKKFFDTFGIEPKEITDRILLELVCLAMDVTDFRASNIEDLKEVVLEVLVGEINNSEEIKHKVQTVFKEQ